MKTETLESLLVDRSLGELDPRTEELLEAYLLRDPRSSESAERIDDAVAGARRVLTRSARETLPEPAWLRTTTASTDWMAPFVRWAPLAACLIAGIGIGWLTRPTESGSPGLVAGSGSFAAAARVELARGNGFWTIENPVFSRARVTDHTRRAVHDGIWRRETGRN